MGSIIISIPRERLTELQRDYRCAGCWNPVTVSFNNQLTDDMSVADCGTDDCPVPGFVTAHYVERRLSKSQAEEREMRDVLSAAEGLGWLKRPRVSAAQAMAELGF